MIIELKLTWIILVYLIVSIILYVELEVIGQKKDYLLSILCSIFWGLVVLYPLIHLWALISTIYKYLLKWVYVIDLILFKRKYNDCNIRHLRGEIYLLRRERKTLLKKCRYIAYVKTAKYNNVDLDSITEEDLWGLS